LHVQYHLYNFNYFIQLQLHYQLLYYSKKYKIIQFCHKLSNKNTFYHGTHKIELSTENQSEQIEITGTEVGWFLYSDCNDKRLGITVGCGHTNNIYIDPLHMTSQRR
jgi:hypothetical protein